MRIILHSYQRKIHLSPKVAYTLSSCSSWTNRFLHKDIYFFFHLQWRIVCLRRMPNGILRQLIDFIYITVCIISGGTVRKMSSRTPIDFEIYFSLCSFSKYKWLVVNSKGQAPTKIIPPPIVCMCMVQIEFQIRYSFIRVIQQKKIHAFTPKNDKFYSVDCRQEMKGTHTSTPKSDEFNSVEGRQEIKGTHVRRRSYKNRATRFPYFSVNQSKGEGEYYIEE
jgi:hypothetical protein